MPLAADYPLLEAIWTIAIIALWAMWIFIVVWTLIDNFKRSDHSGWAKAGWTLFIIFLPLLGVLIYLVARPADVEVYGAPVARPEDRAYAVGAAAPQTDVADQLSKLNNLKNQGVISEEEFQAQKAKLLGS